MLLREHGAWRGIAVNSKTKQETFMKMVSGGAGLGVGVKNYRVVFVFENDDALNPISSIPAGRVQRKRTLRPRRAIKAELSRERRRLAPGSGSIKLPRTVSPSR